MDTKKSVAISPPAPAKPWQKWLTTLVNRKITEGYRSEVEAGFCACCGAAQITPEGFFLPYEGYRNPALIAQHPEYYNRLVEDGRVYGNGGFRILFGKFQDKETLFKNKDCPPDLPHFIIEDGEDTHVLAWREK